MRLNDDEKTVAAMDILVPGVGEIVEEAKERNGSTRSSAKQRSFKAGIVVVSRSKEIWDGPHAGFGFQFERLVQYVSGMENIRDTIPFPRVPKTLRFNGR